jgi:hypothetical protein
LRNAIVHERTDGHVQLVTLSPRLSKLCLSSHSLKCRFTMGLSS